MNLNILSKLTTWPKSDDSADLRLHNGKTSRSKRRRNYSESFSFFQRWKSIDYHATSTLPINVQEKKGKKRQKTKKKKREKNRRKNKKNQHSSFTSELEMDEPTVVVSRFGKKQLCHLGYTFCVNKAPKNNRTYLRCAYGKGPTQCKASVCVVGTLEDGKFQLHVLYHHQDRHSHEPSPIEKAVKQFWERFRKEAREKLTLRFLIVYSLPKPDQKLFLHRLPSLNAALNRGYRARGQEFSNLPKTLDQVKLPESLARTYDEESFYRGRASNAECQLQRRGPLSQTNRNKRTNRPLSK